MSDVQGVLDGAIAPQQNTKLFGHAEAEAFLAQSYRSGKGHHAILIEGPEGIGKATLAFRFANHVLSHPDPSLAPDFLADPDPQSLVSRQITAGASHNLLHLTRPWTKNRPCEIRHHCGRGAAGRALLFANLWHRQLAYRHHRSRRRSQPQCCKCDPENTGRAAQACDVPCPVTCTGKIAADHPFALHAAEAPAAFRCGHGAIPRSSRHQPIRRKRDALLAASKGSVAQALKLMNYGGSDIVEAFAEVMAAEGPGVRKQMHKLAEVLAQKDGDIVLGFFMEHVTEELMERARAAAMAGDIAAAEKHARLSSTLSERITVAQAYNLDKKQMVLSILEDIRGV